MFLDHDNVDALWVFKGKKAETAGAACGAIAHDGTFDHLTEL